MKKLIHFCASVVFLVMFLSVTAHSGDPVAPLVEIRADMADVYEIPKEMADQMINEMEGRIPSAGRVGVPVPAEASYLGGGRMQEMEYVNLVSRDTPEAIQAFYQGVLDEMPGWQWCEQFDVFHMSDESLTVQKLMSFTIPVIEIKELSSDDPMLITVDPDVKAELNTLFQITFR